MADAAPRVVEIALPVPLRRLFSYRVPGPLAGAVQVGSRVLAPLGRRRLTGYVVRVDTPAPEGVKLRAILEVLDAQPAFGPELLALFEWTARYYHDALGEVIRAGLPSALGAREDDVARLTELGRARLEAVLEAELSASDRALLHVLTDGPRPLAEALRAARGADAETARRAQDRGWIEVRAKRTAAARRARTEAVAVYVGPPGVPPVSAKEARVLARIQTAGAIAVKALNAELGRTADNLRRLTESGAIRVEARRVWRGSGPVDDALGGADEAVVLTPAQSAVVARLRASIDAREPVGFLLHGVTGSGKTEVYLRAIAHALAAGRGAITLVPEISLTPQLVARFQRHFGDGIALLHSGLSAGERLDEWEQIRAGNKRVVVGARSAIFAPVPDLGLVVVDEEHEGSFKQGERPRYHARDLALVRGRHAGCPVVLGSATPSLESLANARAEKLELLSLPGRARAQAMPTVEVVDLRRQSRGASGGLLSPRLASALEETVSRGEQAILFINRRGFSSFLLCERCGFIPECHACSISLTYSRHPEHLRCHYCGHREPRPPACPHCHGALEPIGVGTERATDEVVELLGPSVVVERMDRDTAQGASLEALLGRFRRGEVQVIVGTQMVAKGHDFPNVTLVGVLAADQSLRLPDFRASERTFQLVTQVAGRAGRGAKAGRVIVQTWCPEHHSLVASADHDFEAFSAEELLRRQQQGYPPYAHLALVMVTHHEEQRAQDISNDVAHRMRGAAARLHDPSGAPIWVLGPVWAPIQRVKHRSRAQILLKSRDRPRLHRLLAGLDRWTDEQGLHAVIQVDVDPLHLL